MTNRLALAAAFFLALAGPVAARPGGGGHGGGMHGHFGGGPSHGVAPGRGWHGGGWHGGHWGGWRGPRSTVFLGFGPFFYDPFYYSYYPPPYPYPYPAPYDAEYPPDAPEAGADAGDEPPPDIAQSGPGGGAPPAREEAPASYGLVQLRGVPDGASVDLDGRFWMTARTLDDRWLALPQGEHMVAVRLGDEAPVERRVDVAVGKTQVVRFTLRRARS